MDNIMNLSSSGNYDTCDSFEELQSIFRHSINERLSLSVQNGKESLGILHEDFETDSNFLNITDKDTLSFKKIFYSEDSDIGRESLGILQLNNLDVNFDTDCENFPGIMLSFTEDVDSNKGLDTGFLLSSPSKFFLSAVSQNSPISFNSNSLEMPSKIFTLTKNESSISASSVTHSFLNNAKIINSDLECRIRVNSAPLLPSSSHLDARKKCWSTGNYIRSSEVANFNWEKFNFEDDLDEMFHDSVFIEGNHIAQKIADGSFLNDLYEIGPLDSTPQPEWPSELEESLKHKEEIKIDTDSIFKTVDKLLPSSTDSNKETDIKKVRSSSRSRDAKEILQNLSDIFNITHKSDQQRSEGHQLLCNLAEILNSSKLVRDEILEDSGHSSIIEKDLNDEKAEFKKTDVSDTVSDKALISSESIPQRRISESMYPVKKRAQSVEKERSASTSKVDSKTVKSNQDNVGIKLKPKTCINKTKKGPLRAIIPVKEMKKGPATPEKGQHKSVSGQLKKTSTPIMEPTLKPMAASTPSFRHQNEKSPKSIPGRSTLSRSNSLPERNTGVATGTTPTTPKLKRPSLGTSPVSSREKLNGGPSVPSRIQVLNRRSTVENLAANQPKLKRSNSVGKDSRIMSSIRKVRENLLKSPYYHPKDGILVDSNFKLASTVEKKVTFRKSSCSSVKLNRSDKENTLVK